MDGKTVAEAYGMAAFCVFMGIAWPLKHGGVFPWIMGAVLVALGLVALFCGVVMHRGLSDDERHVTPDGFVRAFAQGAKDGTIIEDRNGAKWIVEGGIAKSMGN